MPFVQLDTSGNVIGLFANRQVGYADVSLPDVHPNVVAFLAKQARQRIAKSLILSRLTDAQLDAALAAMTARQKERWRAPDHPAVYADDPEMLALLKVIGADPAVVLAP